MMVQNLCDAVKAVLIRKFIAINLTSRSKKIPNKQHNLTPKAIREKQTKPKVSGKK